MDDTIKITREICDKVLLVGVNYKKNPGGMSSVIQYYEPHFEKLRYISTYCYPNKLFRVVYFAYAILKIFFLLLLDRRLRIVHIHSAADGSFYRASIVIKVCKAFGKKVIFHSHASRFKDFYNESPQKTWIVNTINDVDTVLVLSNSWKLWFASIGVNIDKIEVLNNITSLPQIANIPIKDDKLHLLFLGLIGDRKGIFDIVKAIGENKEVFKTRLLFKIGGNTHEKELLSAINEYGIGDFVQYEGWVSGKKKIDLLNWADVYILPSYNEGLPIGILEAMSYGCAIISSPVGGIPEVVKNEENGIIVEPGNICQISDAIISLFDNQKRKRMSDSNKEKVKNYLPDKVIDNLRCLYKKLLKS